MTKAVQIVCGMLFLAMLGISAVADAGDLLRCGSRLVSVGDTKAEVLIKCGAPAWKDNWTDEVINNVDGAMEQRVSIDRERWIYNFGTRSFLEFLLFENGKLIEISSGGYGYDATHPGAKPCNGNDIKKGLTQYEILQRCGEPFFKDTRNEERLTAMDKHTNRLLILRIDEWTYNFGPDQFLRILKFENGKLVNVETGDRGF